MKSAIVGVLAGAAALVALPAAADVGQLQQQIETAAAANHLSISAGGDYSSGDYGLSGKTRIVIAPLTIADHLDVWRFSASIPYLDIKGPAGVVIGPDGRPLPGVAGVSGHRSGLGDLTLSGGATLPADKLGGFSLELTGRVKLPTSASSQHLGTGKTDYSVEADLSREIGDWGPFLSVGYRIPGSPSTLKLKDSVSASVGTSLVVQQGVVIVSYDYAQASSPLAKDAQDVFFGYSHPLTQRASWTAYGIGGLSKGSPDYEAGLLLTYKVN